MTSLTPRLTGPLSLQRASQLSLRNGQLRSRNFSRSCTRKSQGLPSPEISALSPLVDGLAQLPSLLHLTATPYPYAISIIILTLVFRGTVALPVTVWQRARMQRMAQEVVPRWEVAKKTLPREIMIRCKRKGKSFNEYKQELAAEVSLRTEIAEERCFSPSLVPSSKLR